MRIRDVADWQLTEGGEFSKKAARCASALFFEDTRYEQFVHISPEEFLKTTSARVPPRLRKDHTGHCSFADIVVPIETKADHDSCAFEFEQPLQRVTREHEHSGTIALDNLEQCLGTKEDSHNVGGVKLYELLTCC